MIVDYWMQNYAFSRNPPRNETGNYRKQSKKYGHFVKST